MEKENQKYKNEGVLVVIEHLIEEFSVLIDEIDTKRPNIEVGLTHDTVKSILEKYYEKLKVLFTKVDKSYGLIQMVIQSIHASRSEIKKSVNGLLQKTGVQLQKVTSTTEEATNKILDTAEKLDADQNAILDLLSEIDSNQDKSEIKSKLEKIKEMVYQNQDAAFMIMDYLQFQDITAQQIAGAYAMLADTERTLIYVSNLLRRFAPENEEISKMIEKIDRKSFNERAQFSDKKVLQEAIDDLFNTGNENISIPDDEENQSKDININPIVESNNEEKNTKKDNNDVEKIDQNDIDELFK